MKQVIFTTVLLAILHFNVQAQWQQVFITQNNSNSDFVALSKDTVLLANDGHILRSTNGATSWDTVYSQPTAFINCLFQLNDSVIFARQSIFAVEERILKSTDGGITWLAGPAYTMPDNGSIGDLHFMDENVGVAAALKYMARTTDGGATWTRQTSTISIFFREVTFTNIATGIAVGYGAGLGSSVLIKTTDGGLTWYAKGQNYIGHSHQGLSFASQQVGYTLSTSTLLSPFGTNSLFLKTIDGGDTWFTQDSLFNPDPYVSSGIFRNVTFRNDSTGYALVQKGPFDAQLIYTYQIWKTTDGGSSWSNQLEVQHVLDKILYPSDSVGYILSKNILYKTTNGGGTGSPVTSLPEYKPSKQTLGLQVFPNPATSGQSVSINYELREPSAVEVQITDLQGRVVARPVSLGRQSVGSHSISWQPQGRLRGLYLITLSTKQGRQTTKVVVGE